MRGADMLRHRKSTTLIAAFLGVFVLTMPLQRARATTAGIDHGVVTGTDVYFGSGTVLNFLGPHLGPYTVTWNFSPVGGVTEVTARVQGTLYLARSAGVAKLTVFYEDENGIVLQQRSVQFTGPGGNDPNDSTNQMSVNLSNSPDSRVAIVGLELSEGATTSTTSVEAHGQALIPSVFAALDGVDVINAGTADFGNPPHLLGSPVTGYIINIDLNHGQVTASADGTLFWDSFLAGTAGLFVDFLDANGNVLQTQKFSVTGPFASDATQALNQHHVTAILSNAALFKIRLQCGTLSQGVLNGTAVRTYSLGPAVGTVEGLPFDQAVRAGAPTTYGVKWTVPDPDNWHSLSQMDVRLVDKAGQALLFRWDQVSNTLSQFDPATRLFLAPTLPGSPQRLQGRGVSLLLKDTQVIGSGPTGP